MTHALAEDVGRSTGERFEQIAIELLIASTTNPRTHFDEDYIGELARSIVEKGLIQPVIVRPLDILKAIMKEPEQAARNRAKFEIVAGECRYRASKQAGLATVPAIIREYSDEQVLEIQLIENIHRTDLTPLEQASGYRRLIDTNPTKHSAETIAARVGMSPAWVWDRLKLNDLIPEAKELLEHARISVGHAIPIARLKPADQKRVIEPPSRTGYGVERHSGLFAFDGAGLEWDEDALENAKRKPGQYEGFKARSIREVEKWIADHIRFDVEHAAKAAPLEFEDLAARVEERAAQPGRGKKVIAITFDFLQPEAKSGEERTYGHRSFKFADGQTHTDDFPRRTYVAQTCEYSVLGVVAAGDRRGQAFDVCIARDKCHVHWKKEIAEREKNRKLREGGQAKKADRNEAKARENYEDKWRREQAERERREKAWRGIQERALTAFAEAIVKEGVSKRVVEWHLEGIHPRSSAKTIFDRAVGKVTAANVAVAVLVAQVLDECYSYDEFQKVAKRFGIEHSALEAEYRTAAAPPKAEKKPAAKAKLRKGK